MTSTIPSPAKGRLPSLQQIADACGVSKATVSLALRNRGKLSTDTRQRIRLFAERLGYHEKYRQWIPVPETPATPAVEDYVVVPVNRKVENSESFQTIFAEHMRGLTEGLNTANIPMRLFWFEDDDHEMSEIQKLANQGNLRGIVNFSLQPETTAFLQEHKIPMVTNVQSVADKGVPAVLADSISAYQRTWEYVRGLGHTRTAFVSAKAPTITRHYYECLAGAGLGGCPELLQDQVQLPDIHNPSAISEVLESHWGPHESGRWPTLIFTQNDFIACRVIQALQQKGLRVPEDVSVIGYDDTPAAVCCHPPITTLRKPRYEMGQCLAQLLISVIRGEFVAANQAQVLPMSLIIRESCTSPAAK